MIDFCKFLYDDINAYSDEWVSFVDYYEQDTEEKRQQLFQKLERLKELITIREEFFNQNRCFL